MASSFSKEAVLQGSVDHLCLVCESYLRSESDVGQHVSTADHKENLSKTDYVDKYRTDRIRKVKKWYYCEFCNVLVSMIPKVRLHVEEPRHKENVASQMIARVDDVIVSGNIAIFEDAWNGFIDDNTCIICNVEFDDMDDHKSEPSHVINLIQSKVSNDFQNVYRKIDDSSFHCLTCNTVVTVLSEHFDDEKHKSIMQKCIQMKPALPVKDVKNENGVEKRAQQSINATDVIVDGNDLPNKMTDRSSAKKISDNNTSMECKASTKVDENIVKTQNLIQKSNSNNLKVNKKNTCDILDSISKFQRENIEINFESRTAACRKCLVVLAFDSKVINNHIEEHKKPVQKQSNKSSPLLNKAIDSATLFTSPVFRNQENKNEGTKSTETKKQKDDIIQKMAEEYDFTYTDNKLYCERCSQHIPTTVKDINEHVNGELHKKGLTNKLVHSKDIENKKPSIKKHYLQKVPIHQFVRVVTTVKNLFAEDVVINEKYCINLLAFTFLTMTSPGQLRCQVCEVNLLLKDMKDHLDVKRHERALNEVPVIIHIDSEFIREIRSEIFHCGFCNIIDSWEGMENHLKSTSHKESKNFASWRLSQHLPQIQQHNMQRQIQNDFLMRLMFS